MTKTSWNTTFYDTQHHFVSDYGLELLPLLEPKKNERILDLGCGTGRLTDEIAKTGAEVIGIDHSPEMISAAKKNYPNIQFDRADGHDFNFATPFDAVFSNAALHWMTEPKKVINCVWRCLKNQGRFVLEMGGVGNVDQVLNAIEQAMRKFSISNLSLINYYPSIGEYTSLLEAQGFRVTYAALMDRPTKLEGSDGLRNWIRMFRSSVLTQIPISQQEDFFQEVENNARSFLYHDHIWWADYVRLKVVAVKDNTKTK